MYDIYSREYAAEPDSFTSGKLFVFLRVLFDVPQAYSRPDAAVFAAWIATGSSFPGGNTPVNYLWPLEYQEGRIVLNVRGSEIIRYYGSPYQGLAEYDYFSSRFKLRNEAVLGC
jgi:hypothetical protein